MIHNLYFQRIKVVLFFAAFIFFLFGGNTCFAQESERISAFKSDIQVYKDGSMSVTETITVQSAGVSIRHGIYRDFPVTYKDKLGNSYTVDFKVTSVLRDGMHEPYHLQPLSNGVRIYMGRKDALLAAGQYTYVLTYETNRQLGFFKDFDELYWNVTGNGWAFTIEEAEVRIRLPDGISRKVRLMDGYTGYQGSREKNFSASRDEFGRIIFTTTQPLGPRQGLTIAVSWPKGCISEPTMQKKLFYFLSDNRGLFVGLLGILLLFVYYMTVWSRVGKDPASGTIVTLYDPPAGFSPAAMRYIMKMGYDNKVLTVAVINMAVKGYLSISEADGVFTIKKNNADVSTLTGEERVIAGQLLGPDTALELKNTNHEIVSAAIRNMKRSLQQSFERIYFNTNKDYFFKGLILSAVTVLGSAALVCVEKLPIAIFMSIWLSFWSLGVTALLMQVFSLWRQIFTANLKKSSLLGQAVFLSLFSLPFVCGEIIGIGVLTYAVSPAVAILFLLVAVMNILFYHLLKAPTIQGRRIMDKIEGFKAYLAAVEKDRLNVLYPREKTPELFERYLPYAFALDVEQAWSEQFAAVLASAGSTGQTYHPRWYTGSSWSSFGASNFASSLGASLGSAITSSSAAPGSSSGSGGGGSSGGGGGGGGGGGW